MRTHFKVLDHGYVKLLNISGPVRRRDVAFDASDRDPAIAARQSFGGKEKSLDEDLRLVGYLMRNWHTSPFEMVEVWIEMKLPIFVARQFVRHRTASINEISGRYVTLPDDWYIPERVGGKAASNKQGQADTLSEELQKEFRDNLDAACRDSYARYLHHLERGVAPEHARMFLHLNHYTKWLWHQDLHNMMHLLSLRDHAHAQVESQMYAKVIDTAIRQVLPHSMSLYDKYRRQERWAKDE